MKIRGAALVNRFYVSDGWTREAVAKLLKRPKYPESLGVVVLRYTFELPRDLLKLSEAEIDNLINLDGIPADNGEPYYYAVYDPRAVFDKEKVQQHEYVPFTMMSSNKIYDCDRAFSTKNRWG